MSNSQTPPGNQPASPPPAPPASDGRPDYIPEKFWDPATKAPKIEDLAKSYGQLETKFGQGKTAFEQERLAKRPETADKYELTIEGVDAADLKDSPLIGTLRDVSFELGLAPEEANTFASKMIAALTKDLPKPEDEKAKLGADADARLQALDTFVEKTFTDPDERAAVALVARNAAGVKALEKLIALAGGQGGDTRLAEGQGGPPAAALTKAKLQEMQNDRRYWDPRHRDPAFVKEVQDGFEALSRSAA